MARTRSVVSAQIIRQKYFWPQSQLNAWTILILVTGCTILGVFATFTQAQNRLRGEIPWLFPYGITAGALTVLFIIIQLIMTAQNRLLPGFMMLSAFILLVLYIAGMIQTAILLFGPGAVNASCQRYVNNNPQSGASANTLVWLYQNNICSSWDAAFSFWLIGVIFFVWMLIMSSQVGRGAYAHD
ncbi:hypothetical protein EJ08DRAFT_670918 [Tothia fuscella]|uniref:Uncharacterized protein n=1 Tax=Tothia fuscella TaxID=1048955 RepID=A0A9P4TWU0_9PEZI|nr:hypothetical protein EJ08DRAFT_670918 [Tothia fuscella]